MSAACCIAVLQVVLGLREIALLDLKGEDVGASTVQREEEVRIPYIDLDVHENNMKREGGDEEPTSKWNVVKSKKFALSALGAIASTLSRNSQRQQIRRASVTMGAEKTVISAPRARRMSINVS